MTPTYRLSVPWRCHLAGAVFMLVASVAVAATGPMDFLFESGKVPASADGRALVWKFAEFGALRRVPREAGAPPNAHPAAVEADALRKALQAVLWQPPGPVQADSRVPLFAASEAAELAPALAQALATALPDEDLLLASSARRGGGVLVPPSTVTARLFVQDGRLQLIVHDARAEVYGPHRATRVLPVMAFGSRDKASATVLQAAPATARRADWLALSWVAAVPGTAPEPAVAVPAGSRAAVQANHSAPAPGALVPPRPPARDAAFFSDQAQRLKVLKRLREQDLISAEEYEQKRRAILHSL